MLSYNEYASRQERNDEVRAQATQAARQASSEIERILEGLHSLLIATSTLDSVERQYRAGCVDDLKGIATQVPSIRTIVVLDPTGHLVCDSLGRPAGLDLSDRAYFQTALRSTDYVVGGYTQSRLSDRPVLPVALALRRNGRVTGVIVTGLRLEWLQQRIEERGTSQGNAVTVADGSGIILAREPFPERFVGTRIPDPYQKLIHAPNPGVLEVTSQDGTERILGYQPIGLPYNRLYVSAGISKIDAFAPINRSTVIGVLSIIGGAVLALAAASLVGGRFILRPIHRIANVLERWRHGETDARTGMTGTDELHVVGAALDRLLDELEQRRLTAEQAEQARALLAGELSHRVKNTLAIIQAIARQTFKQQTPAEYRSFSERVAALASGYDILFAEQQQQGMIKAVIERALRPHRADQDVQFKLDGPPVLLPATLVLSMSLVVHELATNAVKYGALRHETGRIVIDWTKSGNEVSFSWREVDGPPVVQPVRDGFGSRLIRNSFPSTASPSVTFSFDECGLLFRLTFVIETED